MYPTYDRILPGWQVEQDGVGCNLFKTPKRYTSTFQDHSPPSTVEDRRPIKPSSIRPADAKEASTSYTELQP
ncbi:hypothetical protein DSO57_1037307 [Entomophthora muscae]|uniref:Uncharacterized protein n=1 Tax=Entomophthora muscae TaxID=34485 RepID=A0ACC2UJQ5_9FUNG|nr:hypothetical protein DSO57_1037307 [Entomophthora muscae]